MSSEFEVTRSILKSAAAGFSKASGNWKGAAGCLGGAKLGADDLGVIGRMANIISRYNAAVDSTWTKLDAGEKALQGGADALNQVEKHYERAEKRAAGRFKS